MKHYEITTGASAWTRAEVTAPDGSKIRYDYFLNAKEAEIWCYAKVRHLYGAETANREFKK